MALPVGVETDVVGAERAFEVALDAGDTQTAVVVPVAAAERAVSRWRQRFDTGAVLGVGAHVTVLFPFAPAAAVDQELLRRLEGIFASLAAFDATFRRCGWFGDDVLWLAPEPDQPFRELTAAVLDAFPAYPPYGGVFDDVVPHLTIAESPLARPDELQEAEAAVGRHLPVAARVERGLLLAGSDRPGSWHALAELPLGPPRRQGEPPSHV